MAAAAAAIIGGNAHVIQFGAVTVTFPSDRFCRNHVDQNVLSKVESVASQQSMTYAGNGFVTAAGVANCGHAHITNRDAIAFKWVSNTSLTIVAYGEKGGRGASGQGSGGYTWTN